MGKAFFITGTGTDIGKTIATSVLYLSLKGMGKKVTIFKPFQTGLLAGTNSYPDISWYEQELGVKDAEFYTLPPETSPHLAVKLTGQRIDPKAIFKRMEDLKQLFDIVLVEGAGGLAVPLFEKTNGFYMTKHLVKDNRLPVIFVSPSGLGAIHNVVVTYRYAQCSDLNVKTVIFNFFHQDDPIDQDNIETIEKLTGLVPLVQIPAFSDVKMNLQPYIDELGKNKAYVNRLGEVFS